MRGVKLLAVAGIAWLCATSATMALLAAGLACLVVIRRRSNAQAATSAV